MIAKSILDPKPDPLQNRKKYAVIVVCTILGLLCSLAYTHLGADFSGISKNQFYGFIFSTVASILQLIAGILSCLCFARSDTTHTFPFKMLMLMGIQSTFCITGIIFFLICPLPSRAELKQYVITNETGNFNNALMRLEEELACCGIDSYEDYQYFVNGEISWQVPPSCCRHEEELRKPTNCSRPQNLQAAPPDYTMGCLQNIADISQLKEVAPGFYLVMNISSYLILGLFSSSIILTITIYGYFNLLYKRHKNYGKKSHQPFATLEPCPSTSTSTSTIPIEHVQTLNNNNSSSVIIPPHVHIVNSKSPNFIHKSRIDYEKVKELSVDQLPGSLSQLSSFLYSSRNGATQIEYRNNQLV